MRRRSLPLLLALGLLAACGQKGPLVRPAQRPRGAVDVQHPVVAPPAVEVAPAASAPDASPGAALPASAEPKPAADDDTSTPPHR
jgi:predicted small lipoprotein YifL